MAKQTINNGETGLISRNKLNDNFTELYDDKVPYTGATEDVVLGAFDIEATSGRFGTTVDVYSGNFNIYVLAYRATDAAAGLLALNSVAGWQMQVITGGTFEINRYSPTQVTGLAIDASGNVTIGGIARTGAKTVATLPTASSYPGGRTYVTDSTVAASGNFGATVAGGGANVVPVFSNGTNWIIG